MKKLFGVQKKHNSQLDSIFHKHLDEFPRARAGDDGVPLFVTKLVTAIEKSDDDGVYREKPSTKNLESLIKQIENSDEFEAGNFASSTLSGALKKWVEEYPGTLCGDVQTLDIGTEGFRGAVREAVSRLPAPRRNTLNLLLRHFQTMVDRTDGVDVESLAHMFGPLLFQTESNLDTKNAISACSHLISTSQNIGMTFSSLKIGPTSTPLQDLDDSDDDVESALRSSLNLPKGSLSSSVGASGGTARVGDDAKGALAASAASGMSVGLGTSVGSTLGSTSDGGKRTRLPAPALTLSGGSTGRPTGDTADVQTVDDEDIASVHSSSSEENDPALQPFEGTNDHLGESTRTLHRSSLAGFDLGGDLFFSSDEEENKDKGKEEPLHTKQPIGPFKDMSIPENEPAKAAQRIESSAKPSLPGARTPASEKAGPGRIRSNLSSLPSFEASDTDGGESDSQEFDPSSYDPTHRKQLPPRATTHSPITRGRAARTRPSRVSSDIAESNLSVPRSPRSPTGANMTESLKTALLDPSAAPAPGSPAAAPASPRGSATKVDSPRAPSDWSQGSPRWRARPSPRSTSKTNEAMVRSRDSQPLISQRSDSLSAQLRSARNGSLQHSPSPYHDPNHTRTSLDHAATDAREPLQRGGVSGDDGDGRGSQSWDNDGRGSGGLVLSRSEGSDHRTAGQLQHYQRVSHDGPSSPQVIPDVRHTSPGIHSYARGSGCVQNPHTVDAGSLENYGGGDLHGLKALWRAFEDQERSVQAIRVAVETAVMQSRVAAESCSHTNARMSELDRRMATLEAKVSVGGVPSSSHFSGMPGIGGVGLTSAAEKELQSWLRRHAEEAGSVGALERRVASRYKGLRVTLSSEVNSLREDISKLRADVTASREMSKSMDREGINDVRMEVSSVKKTMAEMMDRVDVDLKKLRSDLERETQSVRTQCTSEAISHGRKGAHEVAAVVAIQQSLATQIQSMTAVLATMQQGAARPMPAGGDGALTDLPWKHSTLGGNSAVGVTDVKAELRRLDESLAALNEGSLRPQHRFTPLNTEFTPPTSPTTSLSKPVFRSRIPMSPTLRRQLSTAAPTSPSSGSPHTGASARDLEMSSPTSAKQTQLQEIRRAVRLLDS
eukprot:Rmarinus@m.24464